MALRAENAGTRALGVSDTSATMGLLHDSSGNRTMLGSFVVTAFWICVGVGGASTVGAYLFRNDPGAIDTAIDTVEERGRQAAEEAARAAERGQETLNIDLGLSLGEGLALLIAIFGVLGLIRLGLNRLNNRDWED